MVYIKNSSFYLSSSVLVERKPFAQELIEPDPILEVPFTLGKIPSVEPFPFSYYSSRAVGLTLKTADRLASG
jgi:hypothetical protein